MRLRPGVGARLRPKVDFGIRYIRIRVRAAANGSARCAKPEIRPPLFQKVRQLFLLPAGCSQCSYGVALEPVTQRVLYLQGSGSWCSDLNMHLDTASLFLAASKQRMLRYFVRLQQPNR